MSRVVELRCINTNKTSTNRSECVNETSQWKLRLIDMMYMDELMYIWQMVRFRIFSSRSLASRSFGKGPTCNSLDVDVVKVIRSR